MSITVVVINHSSYADFWVPCIEQLTLESEITCSQIDLQEIWEIDSNFNWDTQLKSITDDNKTRTLVLIAYGCGTILLKSWLKANQVLLATFKVHAILIDSPPISSWQNNNPLEKLVKMDRATYKDEVLKTLTTQSAEKDWIQSIPSKTNYLKSLLLEVYEKTKLLDDERPLVPLLEEWHEIYSASLPISSANILRQRRISLPNWQSLEILGPNMSIFPTSNLIPSIHRIIADILCRSKQQN